MPCEDYAQIISSQAPTYEERFELYRSKIYPIPLLKTVDDVTYSVFPPARAAAMAGWILGRMIFGPDRDQAVQDLYDSAGSNANQMLSAAFFVGGMAGEEPGIAEETGVEERPVVFDTENWSENWIDKGREYCDRCNQELDSGVAMERVSTSGELRRQASLAASQYRAQRAEEGNPIPDGYAAGHVPDTTWTGQAVPKEWMDLPHGLNSSLGAQSQRYPYGYKPTTFMLDVDLGRGD